MKKGTPSTKLLERSMPKDEKIWKTENDSWPFQKCSTHLKKPIWRLPPVSCWVSVLKVKIRAKMMEPKNYYVKMWKPRSSECAPWHPRYFEATDNIAAWP